MQKDALDKGYPLPGLQHLQAAENKIGKVAALWKKISKGTSVTGNIAGPDTKVISYSFFILYYIFLKSFLIGRLEVEGEGKSPS